MKRGINKVIVMGNLGKDPEMRYTPNGKPVTQFSVAVNEVWGSEESQKSVEWFNIEVWGKPAEILNEHLKKGSPIYIEGRQKTDKYKDKESGADVYRQKIVATDFRFLGGAQTAGSDQAAEGGETGEEETSFGFGQE